MPPALSLAEAMLLEDSKPVEIGMQPGQSLWPKEPVQGDLPGVTGCSGLGADVGGRALPGRGDSWGAAAGSGCALLSVDLRLALQPRASFSAGCLARILVVTHSQSRAGPRI